MKLLVPVVVSRDSARQATSANFLGSTCYQYLGNGIPCTRTHKVEPRLGAVVEITQRRPTDVPGRWFSVAKIRRLSEELQSSGSTSARLCQVTRVECTTPLLEIQEHNSQGILYYRQLLGTAGNRSTPCTFLMLPPCSSTVRIIAHAVNVTNTAPETNPRESHMKSAEYEKPRNSSCMAWVRTAGKSVSIMLAT